MVALTQKQKDILDASRPLLVTGGPGSGKTTVAILKAAALVPTLKPTQRILFLSFARATVARIIEAIEQDTSIDPTIREAIEVDTYHAFFWRLLKTHGYLLGLPRRLYLLTPPNEAIALSAIRRGYKARRKLSDAKLRELEGKEDAERQRLAKNDGRIVFNQFGPLVARLMKCTKIRDLVAQAYPFVILDEFQDTTAPQWEVMKSLGDKSGLIALADPEQRIFEFAGAEEKRIQQYKDTFKAETIDLAGDNHRSKGTDIAEFGNDILKGTFRPDRAYLGIAVDLFPCNANQAFAKLHGEVLKARARLIKSGAKGWTRAVLVPTRQMTRLVSDKFREPVGSMPPIQHTAAVDMEGPILAAELIALLLQQPKGSDAERQCVDLICGFYRGRDGENIGVGNAAEADRIDAAYARCVEKEQVGKQAPKNSLFHAMRATLAAACALGLSGDPASDWVEVRRVLEMSDCFRMREIAGEVRNIRLMERGAQLRQSLLTDWISNSSYPSALSIIRQAFVQEHFAAANRPDTGVVVMNMHKAKGKQFDEVIIFEGWPILNGGQISANPNRIVRSNIRTKDLGQARQNFRVSVTRARQRTSILTPDRDPCILLLNS